MHYLKCHGKKQKQKKTTSHLFHIFTRYRAAETHTCIWLILVHCGGQTQVPLPVALGQAASSSAAVSHHPGAAHHLRQLVTCTHTAERIPFYTH